jgi:LytS/YehU family sensor histidine kinase
MEYNKIVSVTGLPGLFELVSSKSDGAVVRSLEDNLSKFVSTRQHNFSHLESIEVYTTTSENTNLSEVFQAMKSSDQALPDLKDNKALKSYFDVVYPDLDFERVYSSDMKKIIKWYQIIEKNEIEIKMQTAEEKQTAADAKNAKPLHTENTHVKDMKPQQSNPRKIESRGVK